MKLSASNIIAWCEEWELDPADRRLLLQRYAEGEDEWELMGFMADLASEKMTAMYLDGTLLSLDDLLNTPRGWSGRRNFRRVL